MNEIGDKKISRALMSSFIVLIIQYYILSQFNLLNSSESYYIQNGSKLLVAFIYLLALPVVWKRNSIYIIGSYFVTTAILLFNLIVFRENQEYIKSILFALLFMGIPSLIYAKSIYNFSVFKKYMLMSSNIILFFGVVITLNVFGGIVSIGTYSMTLSYYMLLPAILYLDRLFEGLSHLTVFKLILSIIIIVVLGARGPILCILFYGLIAIILKLKKFTYTNVLVSILSFFVVIGVFFNFSNIMRIMYNFLFTFGIKSRTLWLLMNSNFDLSGRNQIANTILSKISTSPILGIGIAGDRLYLEGAYSHNIVIELWANFGVIIGSLILIYLLCVWIKTALMKNKEHFNILLIWTSLGFIHLLLSSSYLIDFRFWIFLGVLLNKNYTVKKQKLSAISNDEVRI